MTATPPPRIGLTTYREPAAWGVWNQTADLLPASYADCVAGAGAIPLLLPPAAPDLGPGAEAALDGVHGLVLAGGADVDPARYGAERDAHTGPARPDRDAWEIALARAALDRRMPLLAICRGLQVLNVALGGDLLQHLPDRVGNDIHCPTVGEHGRHPVRLSVHTRIGELLGGDATVATYHHQGVDRLGRGLVATGWAEDGTVEAVEFDGRGWVVGVQWHPEVHDGERLFAGLRAACDHYRTGPAR
ncbi:MAG TPA: gamma-glutamyl-gamma-aminobutyrate hydrolase family protein [Jatrophihabitans sp.]|nr:gamma-glutamyl-gamma-aminobutyrate hydrolase family protein [Jatrophihabitans sp.]